eukprot:g26688.t1
MSSNSQNRRDFLKTTTAAAATTPLWFPTIDAARAAEFKAPNDRPIIGCIGTGSRWGAVGPNAMQFGDCVAVCDVDSNHAERAAKRVKSIQGKKGRPTDIAVHEDYRKILDRKDVKIVTIVTTDHWHSKIAIEAMKAGKDVYCEKPLTLTIEEGKQIRKVLEETEQVFQVGTQQRSEMGLKFLQAAAMVRDGRIGQAPLVDYRAKGRKTRCHYEFRWWYEYSGGKMTDWGAHHIDIAQWAIGLDNTGPISVEGKATHPVPFRNGHPTDETQYNAATKFHVVCKFANGVEMHIRDNASSDLGFGNGIMFEGTKGRFLVNRGKIVGKPVAELQEKPLPEGLMQKLYKGKKPGGRNAHMRNFMECVQDRTQPISDVITHHRAMTTCHLANIAIRLDRKLTWDPKTEQIVGDSEANQWQAREQRKGYEIKV